MSTSKLCNYRFLVLAEWITTCGKLLVKLECDPPAGYDKQVRIGKTSLDACPSECEKEGNGKEGCCDWPAYSEKCYWKPDVRSPIPKDHPNPEGFFAVFCTSK